MLLLDVTVVNVALPDIRRELGGSFTDMQWVVDAYALAWPRSCSRPARSATCSAAAASSLTGIVLFVAASLVCGLAGTPTVLNIARGCPGRSAGR